MDFESHRAAALARRILVPGQVKLFNVSGIKQVDWAEPDMEGVNKEPPKKKIFVKAFPQFLSEEVIRAYFNDLCEGQVQYIMNGPNYGFITFATPYAASLVMEKKEDLRLAGMKLTIDWWISKWKDGCDDSPPPPPRPVLTPSKHSVNRGPPPQPRRPQEMSSPPRPLEELLQLTRGKGWGDPQYRLTSYLDHTRRPVYQYSVTFTAVPFKISGAESFNKHQAFVNCARLARAALSQERVPSPALAEFRYVPLSSPPSRQTSTLGSSTLLNFTNLRI